MNKPPLDPLEQARQRYIGQRVLDNPSPIVEVNIDVSETMIRMIGTREDGSTVTLVVSSNGA